MRSNKCQGFTLVELLISLVLAMLLLNILIFLLLGSYKNLQRQFAEQQVLTQAMEAEHILRQDATMSGYLGCRTMNNLMMATHPTAITGSNHSITFSFLSPAQFVAQPLSNSTQTIVLTANLGAHAGDIGVIADCQHAESFAIETDSQNNFSHPALQFSYSPTARFGLLSQHQYSTADTNRKYSNDESIPALYQDDSSRGRMELVAGISDLQVSYWQQSNFVAADQIADWRQVTKIRVSFNSEAAWQKQIVHHKFTLDIRLRNNLS